MMLFADTELLNRTKETSGMLSSVLMKNTTNKRKSCFVLKTMSSPSVPRSKRSGLHPIRTFTDIIESLQDKHRLTYYTLTMASCEPGYPVNNMQPGAAVEKSPIESPWIDRYIMNFSFTRRRTKVISVCFCSRSSSM